MVKRLVSLAVLYSLLYFSTPAFAIELWNCAAIATHITNKPVWNYLSPNHEDARYIVEKKCTAFNNHKPCAIICYPSHEYWRCAAHDTPAVDTKTGQMHKQGSWYWTSSENRQIAINGAKDACRHNSGSGGCYVNPDECAKS